MACEGCGTSSCCCGEITRIKGGIHPEHLITTARVMRTNRRYQLFNSPAHFCTATIGIQKLAADRYATLRLFSTSDPNDPEQDQTALMFSLVSGQGHIESSVQAYGLPFLSGMYAELIVQPYDADARVFINMITVARDNFSPAYQRSDETLRYYWSCWRPGETFLGDWDSGSYNDSWNDGGGDKGIIGTWEADDYAPWEGEGGGGDGEGGALEWDYIIMEGGGDPGGASQTDAQTMLLEHNGIGLHF